jgi:hypothetical protein
LDNSSSWKFKHSKTIFSRCGIQTAALAFGGDTGTYTAATEEYDGSTWTSVTSLNTARGLLAGNAGTQTAALGFGGAPGGLTATEEWTGAGAPLTQTITVS